MRRFLQIFILTFALGMIWVLMWQLFGVDSVKSYKNSAPAKKIAENSKSSTDFSKPLVLPNSAIARAGAKEGWEYSGEISANFVSARAQIDSWMQNQGWIPENKITLDENIAPKVILTFKSESEELTILLWKISTNETGFAYRRESENLKETGIQ